jgi:hypothetical protein
MPVLRCNLDVAQVPHHKHQSVKKRYFAHHFSINPFLMGG